MSDSEHIIPDEPFKGHKVEMADGTYVSIFDAIAEEFMRAVFDRRVHGTHWGADAPQRSRDPRRSPER